jgi:hypothetical protein
MIKINIKSVQLNSSELLFPKVYHKPLEGDKYFECTNFKLFPDYNGCGCFPSISGEKRFYYPMDIDKFIFYTKKDGRSFKVIHEGAIDILKKHAVVKIEE